MEKLTNADTIVGQPATRPPAQLPRDRMIRNAKRYAACARKHGFRYVAQICEIAADAIVALNAAELRANEADRRLAIAHRRISELEHQVELESFRTMEQTKKRPDSTQEIRRIHGDRS